VLSYSNFGTSQEREGEIQGFTGIGTESIEYPGNSQFNEGETLQIQAVIPGIQLNDSLLCSTIAQCNPRSLVPITTSHDDAKLKDRQQSTRLQLYNSD
jgi:hypothetical protein